MGRKRLRTYAFSGMGTVHTNHTFRAPGGTPKQRSQSGTLFHQLNDLFPAPHLPFVYAESVSHTYVFDLVHCVFSTKNRRNLIKPEIQPDLWAFLGGIARKNGFKALIVGGTENHVHVLLSLPAQMPLAKAMQLIKGASSHWMNEKHTKAFAWQEGYGAFTVGISQKDDTIAYIQSQPEHHRKRSFEEEFVAFLKKHNVEYDPKYVWG